jgi:hypothetical protein
MKKNDWLTLVTSADSPKHTHWRICCTDHETLLNVSQILSVVQQVKLLACRVTVHIWHNNYVHESISNWAVPLDCLYTIRNKIEVLKKKNNTMLYMSRVYTSCRVIFLYANNKNSTLSHPLTSATHTLRCVTINYVIVLSYIHHRG